MIVRSKVNALVIIVFELQVKETSLTVQLFRQF